MSRPSLQAHDHFGRGYRISWYLPDEGDFGATLGDAPGDKKWKPADVHKATPEDRDWVAAEVAAGELARAQGTERDSNGYVWPSLGAAKTALRAIKARMASLLSDVPWPEWAVKARAEGWKPPKGWKP